MGRSRPWRKPIVAVLVLACLGHGLPAVAAEPPIMFTEAQLTSALLGPAVQVKDSPADYDKDVVISSELVDWRQKNPAASAQQMDEHIRALQTAVAILPQDHVVESRVERRRQLLRAVYAKPGMEIIGPRMTDLLAVVTGRDLHQGLQSTEQRLTGAQQGLSLEIAYDKAAKATWDAVHARAATDGVFAAAWRDRVGSARTGEPFAVDATASLDTLKNLPRLREVANVDRIVNAANSGKTAFYGEVQRQIDLYTKNAAALGLPAALQAANATTPMPDKPDAKVDQATIDRYKKDEEFRQKTIDVLNSGGQYLVSAVKYVDAGLGNKIAQYLAPVAKILSSYNQLITAVGTIGAATSVGAAFGGIGAAVGAAVGIVQVFLGLLGNSQGSEQAAQKQILDAINRGFIAVHADLQSIRVNMNERFDRIDKTLDQIYGTMVDQFNQLILAIRDVSADVKLIHRQLLGLQSQLQDFGGQILSSLKDTQKDQFINAATHYVDYPVYNNGRTLPSYDNYAVGADTFRNAGRDTARNGTFTQMNYAQQDATQALTARGSGAANGAPGIAGAVDWLASYSNRNYGSSYSVPDPARPGTMTPNTDLWAEAARAYYLTALQNPHWAAGEGSDQARAKALIDAGEEIRRAGGQINKYRMVEGQYPRVFEGLFWDGHDATKALTTQAENVKYDSAVINPERPFNIWDNVEGIWTTLSDERKLPIPADRQPRTVASCGGGDVADVPANVNKWDDISHALMVGWWIDPRSSLEVCYSDGSYVEYNSAILCERGQDDDWCWRSHSYRLNVTFTYRVHANGKSIEAKKVAYGRGEVRKCSWWGWKKGPMPDVGAEGERCHYSAPSVVDELRNTAPKSQLSPYGSNPPVSTTAGLPEVTKVLSDRRATFYSLVADKISQGQLPAANDLNNDALLWRAYSEVVIPRLSRNDDTLRRYLYGPNSLIADTPVPLGQDVQPILTASYRQAAAKQAESGVLDGPLVIDTVNEEMGDCARLRSVRADAVTACVMGAAQMRLSQVLNKINSHFSDETPMDTSPLVDEVLDNLQLVRQYVTTAYPTTPPRR